MAVTNLTTPYQPNPFGQALADTGAGFRDLAMGLGALRQGGANNELFNNLATSTLAQVQNTPIPAGQTASPLRSAISGMQPEQLANLFRSNPRLALDPTFINGLLMGTPGQTHEIAGKLVRVKPDGSVEQLADFSDPKIDHIEHTDDQGNFVTSIMRNGEIVKQVALGKKKDTADVKIETKIDPQGNKIAAIFRDGKLAETVDLGPARDTKEPTGAVRQQKIADAMRVFGVDEATAVGVVDGAIDVTTAPDGSRVIINKATGSAKDITPPPRGQIQLLPEEKTTQVLPNIGEAVGAGAVAKEFIGRTAGQLIPALVDPDTAKARTAMSTLRNRLVAALSISSRPPVIEQERINDMLPSTGIFESKERAEAVLSELRGQLIRQYNTDAAYINEAKGDTSSERSRVREIQRILHDIGYASPSEGEFKAAPSTDYRSQLLGSEGGGDYASRPSPLGHLAGFQMGAERLSELGLYAPASGEDLKANSWGGVMRIPGFPNVRTKDDFVRSKEAQDTVLDIHTRDVAQRIAADGLDSKYLGQVVGGVPVTPNAMQAVAHLGGYAGLKQFLESGGTYNPDDKKGPGGTKLSDYALRFGIPQATVAQLNEIITTNPKLAPALLRALDKRVAELERSGRGSVRADN